MAGADCRVLIVGCGISGVAAAQRLVKSGFKQVRILEATGRSGGRILTETLGADIIEVGAASIHGPSEENPLFCVARDYGLLAPEALTQENQSMDVDERPPLVSNWFSSAGDDAGVPEEDDCPQLLRTRSDASFVHIQRRTKIRSARDLQRLRTHRFSINGHFYNHKTSVFTPAYGSVTNVRVNSSMTTGQVLNLLLHKFRVENKSDEFVLYMVHESGERTRLRDDEHPLVTRVLHGPCEKISKILITEADLGEEVTYDVAQYIKLEIPVLDSFVQKLKEEEEREIKKLTRK
ncbi:unnamed protein product [Tetraodon nigroviridis]|uniref:(spotted green pufferfish) hypothetical protein n=1 Tax=Tetraodon nigroviridis TaxID=99883 RepID=Q4RQE7_TETNG|nr:unnamed protein product [Tetraodon nigroviridis]